MVYFDVDFETENQKSERAIKGVNNHEWCKN